MSRGNAIVGPLWSNHSIDIPCDNQFRYVDCFTGVNWGENVHGEIQAYTQANSTDTAGYLLMDYELEFADNMFAPHSSIVPISTGGGQELTLTDLAIPVAGNAVRVTNSTINAPANGTIWKCVIDTDRSTFGAGNSALLAWNGVTTAALTLGTIGTTATNYVITDGMVVYLVVNNADQYVYNSLDAAIVGVSTGQLFYRTASATTSTYLVNAYQVRAAMINIANAS